MPVPRGIGHTGGRARCHLADASSHPPLWDRSGEVERDDHERIGGRRLASPRRGRTARASRRLGYGFLGNSAPCPVFDREARCRCSRRLGVHFQGTNLARGALGAGSFRRADADSTGNPNPDRVGHPHAGHEEPGSGQKRKHRPKPWLRSGRGRPRICRGAEGHSDAQGLAKDEEEQEDGAPCSSAETARA